MKKLILLASISIAMISCTKGVIAPEDFNEGPAPQHTLTIQTSNAEYRGYLLSYVQREYTAQGNYRIVAQTAFNTYTVWFGVNPNKVTVTGVNNSANAPAVFLEYVNNVFTGNYILQVPANYQTTIYND